jgi:hypothetical protein
VSTNPTNPTSEWKDKLDLARNIAVQIEWWHRPLTKNNHETERESAALKYIKRTVKEIVRSTKATSLLLNKKSESKDFPKRYKNLFPGALP